MEYDTGGLANFGVGRVMKARRKEDGGDGLYILPQGAFPSTTVAR